MDVDADNNRINGAKYLCDPAARARARNGDSNDDEKPRQLSRFATVLSRRSQ
ncbi:hypothetical protein Oter_4409 [Opitutus terrae PB90-1]|uniref:Uncharacterized protein n=1 Tax=Opitutus terrae (strain DSM 11246 / JCM 15787 / PB90-1) TaxID=452637 RepID=B1ZRN2_OPITP|nr:hypothetical protein Oter_4409 [Opitutus terrae PB90-1]